jgi:hypothetical protein
MNNETPSPLIYLVNNTSHDDSSLVNNTPYDSSLPDTKSSKENIHSHNRTMIKNLKEFVASNVIEHLSKNKRMLSFIKDNYNIVLYECTNLDNPKLTSKCYGWGSVQKKIDAPTCDTCNKLFCTECQTHYLLQKSGGTLKFICVSCLMEHKKNTIHAVSCEMCHKSENMSLIHLPKGFIEQCCFYCKQCHYIMDISELL